MRPPGTHIWSTASDLARFHEERSRLYTAIAEILDATDPWSIPSALSVALDTPPTPYGRRAREHLSRVAESLHGAGGRTPSTGASLDGAGALKTKATSPVPGACLEPADPARVEAFARVGCPVAPSRASEIRVLARFAGHCADAIRNHQLPYAADLCNAQRRFLERHGQACLTALAADLEDGPDPYRRHLGGALSSLIGEELELLGGGKGNGASSDPRATIGTKK